MCIILGCCVLFAVCLYALCSVYIMLNVSLNHLLFLLDPSIQYPFLLLNMHRTKLVSVVIPVWNATPQLPDSNCVSYPLMTLSPRVLPHYSPQHPVPPVPLSTSWDWVFIFYTQLGNHSVLVLLCLAYSMYQHDDPVLSLLRGMRVHPFLWVNSIWCVNT